MAQYNNTQQAHDVVLTSMRRHHGASTSVRRHVPAERRIRIAGGGNLFAVKGVDIAQAFHIKVSLKRSAGNMRCMTSAKTILIYAGP